MNKGQSYIRVSEEENPNDPMIKALKAKGINNADILYASHWSSDAGWTLVNSNKGACWLGFTRKGAMELIERIGFEYGEIVFLDKKYIEHLKQQQ